MFNLIARRIREQNVHSVVLPCTAKIEEIRAQNPVGIVLSGRTVLGVRRRRTAGRSGDSGRWGCRCWEFATACSHHASFGRARAVGGEAGKYGPADVEVIDTANPLFAELPASLHVWMSHGDEAPGSAAGISSNGEDVERGGGDGEPGAAHLGGASFIREVHHNATGHGAVCGILSSIYATRARIGRQNTSFTARWRRFARIGTGHALCALSGGVDSSVAAVLVHRAIGDHLTCVFVNTGCCGRMNSRKCSRTCATSWG